MCACIGLIDLHFHVLEFVCRLAEGSKLDLKANPPRAALRAHLLHAILFGRLTVLLILKVCHRTETKKCFPEGREVRGLNFKIGNREI